MDSIPHVKNIPSPWSKFHYIKDLEDRMVLEMNVDVFTRSLTEITLDPARKNRIRLMTELYSVIEPLNLHVKFY